MITKQDSVEFDIGIDELNTCEFPITALTNKPNYKPIKCVKVHMIKGKTVMQKWILDGSLTAGTPIAIDEEVLLGLCALAYEFGNVKHNNRVLVYTTWELLRKLKWPISSRYYDIHDIALYRLRSATIFSENSFWDHRSKGLITIESWGLIERFKLRRRSDSKAIEKYPDLAKCYKDDIQYNECVFSEIFWNSIQAGYVKRLNLDYYLSLNLPISRRLFRFLDKVFYNRDKACFNIRELCYNHLGLISKYHDIAQLKRLLDKAHNELRSVKNIADEGIYFSEFLKLYQYVNDKVIYVRNPNWESNKFVPPSQFLPSDAQSLVVKFWRGLGREYNEIDDREIKCVRELIHKHGSEKTNKIIEYAVEKIKERKQEVKSFGYVNAVYEREYLEKEKEEEERRKKIERYRKWEEERKKREEMERKKKLEYFESLPESVKAKVFEKAENHWKKFHFDEMCGSRDTEEGREAWNSLVDSCKVEYVTDLMEKGECVTI